jgi:hypothetical protein
MDIVERVSYLYEGVCEGKITEELGFGLAG